MRWLRHAVLAVLGLAWLGPVYLLVVNSVASPGGFRVDAPWVPGGMELLANVADAWRSADLGASVASTALYGVAGAAGAVAAAALASFAIVVLRLSHGFAWFMLIYAGTIFPFQMYIAPLFTTYADSGLYDTHAGMLLFYTAIAIPFATFVLRNHFTSIARDIFEAARMDGASAWRIFWRIHVPLSWSALGAVFVFQFTWIWNDLLFGLSLSRSESVRPIMTALSSLQGAYGNTSVPVVLAGALVVSLPTIVLFFALQRLFVSSLRVGT
jgi:multiple sugar transport system permease protein